MAGEKTDNVIFESISDDINDKVDIKTTTESMVKTNESFAPETTEKDSENAGNGEGVGDGAPAGESAPVETSTENHAGEATPIENDTKTVGELKAELGKDGENQTSAKNKDETPTGTDAKNQVNNNTQNIVNQSVAPVSTNEMKVEPNNERIHLNKLKRNKMVKPYRKSKFALKMVKEAGKIGLLTLVGGCCPLVGLTLYGMFKTTKFVNSITKSSGLASHVPFIEMFAGK